MGLPLTTYRPFRPVVPFVSFQRLPWIECYLFRVVSRGFGNYVAAMWSRRLGVSGPVEVILKKHDEIFHVACIAVERFRVGVREFLANLNL